LYNKIANISWGNKCWDLTCVLACMLWNSGTDTAFETNSDPFISEDDKLFAGVKVTYRTYKYHFLCGQLLATLYSNNNTEYVRARKVSAFQSSLCLKLDNVRYLTLISDLGVLHRKDRSSRPGDSLHPLLRAVLLRGSPSRHALRCWNHILACWHWDEDIIEAETYTTNGMPYQSRVVCLLVKGISKYSEGHFKSFSASSSLYASKKSRILDRIVLKSNNSFLNLYVDQTIIKIALYKNTIVLVSSRMYD
jgi:hypothetical protein